MNVVVVLCENNSFFHQLGHNIRECVRKGAAGARTRRPLGHCLLHPQILTFYLYSVAELIGHETKHIYLHNIKHFLPIAINFYIFQQIKICSKG